MINLSINEPALKNDSDSSDNSDELQMDTQIRNDSIN